MLRPQNNSQRRHNDRLKVVANVCVNIRIEKRNVAIGVRISLIAVCLVLITCSLRLKFVSFSCECQSKQNKII